MVAIQLIHHVLASRSRTCWASVIDPQLFPLLSGHPRTTLSCSRVLLCCMLRSTRLVLSLRKRVLSSSAGRPHISNSVGTGQMPICKANGKTDNPSLSAHCHCFQKLLIVQHLLKREVKGMEMHILTEQGVAAKLWCQHDISFPQAGPLSHALTPVGGPIDKPKWDWIQTSS